MIPHRPLRLAPNGPRQRPVPPPPEIASRCRRTAAAALLAAALAGCSSLLLTGGAPPAPRPPPPGLSLSNGATASRTGCRLAYTLYRPQHGADAPLVVLGHGFLRARARMAGLAEAIAAAGLPVATLDYCNMRPWAGRHQQNGLDMIALARHLGAERVLYAGFSAGGLAAVIAGRNDPRALGVVTLDLVEAGGLGARAAAALAVPLIGLAGEPTNCNAGGNGRRVFAAAGGSARLERLPGAGHCDFEAPTDALCELLCDDPAARPDTTGTPREAIIAATTDAILALAHGHTAGTPRAQGPGRSDGPG